MKTVRNFFNIAEAQFAKSVLESAGIYSVLIDEHMYTMGPQFAHAGIRLQVWDRDLDQARKVLEEQDGFSPLPEDFVPPAEPKPIRHIKPIPTMGAAFVQGGLWAWGIFLVLAFLGAVFGGKPHADLGGLVLLFVEGGIVGLIVRAIYKKGREDGERSR